MQASHVVNGGIVHIAAVVGSFAATDSLTLLDMTAVASTGQMLADLEALLEDGEFIESSYDFEMSGLPGGDFVLLSFAISGSTDLDDLSIWHYDQATGWTQHTADDLLLANGWASFTVDGFSSYAVVSVPEPATLTLLAFIEVALLCRKRNVCVPHKK